MSFITGLWYSALENHVVTRARAKCNYESGRSFSGFEFGRGRICFRMYDKPMEISQKSKKSWFFDIWNLNEDEFPDELRIIRMEYQLRREVLNELAMDTVWDVVNHPRNLWAYCTREWLKFTDDPLKDPREQQVLAFWKTVQEGFLGGQCGHPLIRAKAVNVKKKQLAQQLMGQLTSLIVIDTDEFAPQLQLEEKLALVTQSAELLGIDNAALSERVRRKQGKYLKAIEKFRDAEMLRARVGLPHGRKEAKSA